MGPEVERRELNKEKLKCLLNCQLCSLSIAAINHNSHHEGASTQYSKCRVQRGRGRQAKYRITKGGSRESQQVVAKYHTISTNNSPILVFLTNDSNETLSL